MIPAKARDFIPGLASQIGIPEEDLEKMVSFYFKEVKRMASELEALHINLPGLGILSAKGWDLQKTIDEQKQKLANCSKDESIEAVQQNITYLENALELWKKELNHKASIQQKKRDFYAKKQTDETERTTPDSLEE